MRWVWTNISSIYYFTEIPIILKQHIQSDWITNEPRKPWGDVLRTLSADGRSETNIPPTTLLFGGYNNYKPHRTMDIITYPCLNLSETMLVKGAPGDSVRVCITGSLFNLTLLVLKLENSGMTMGQYKNRSLSSIRKNFNLRYHLDL